jgi:muramoyltetrapeptide carboxypeptidase LdcA involved in peptidoglycan recycling
VQTLRSGKAAGKLYGGCLSMLVASLGTPFEIQTADTILFIEDIAEKPYRIDRMLMQLRLAGKLDGVRGFVFGEMLDCAPPVGESYTLQQVIMRVLAPFNVPIVYGLKSGHVTSGNITLPIGVLAELAAGNSTFRPRRTCNRNQGTRLLIYVKAKNLTQILQAVPVCHIEVCTVCGEAKSYAAFDRG